MNPQRSRDSPASPESGSDNDVLFVTEIRPGDAPKQDAAEGGDERVGALLVNASLLQSQAQLLGDAEAMSGPINLHQHAPLNQTQPQQPGRTTSTTTTATTTTATSAMPQLQRPQQPHRPLQIPRQLLPQRPLQPQRNLQPQNPMQYQRMSQQRQQPQPQRSATIVHHDLPSIGNYFQPSNPNGMRYGVPSGYNVGVSRINFDQRAPQPTAANDPQSQPQNLSTRPFRPVPIAPPLPSFGFQTFANQAQPFMRIQIQTQDMDQPQMFGQAQAHAATLRNTAIIGHLPTQRSAPTQARQPAQGLHYPGTFHEQDFEDNSDADDHVCQCHCPSHICCYYYNYNY